MIDFQDMMLTRHGTASHMEKVVAKYQRAQNVMEDKVEQEQEAARKLVYYQDDDGMWVIHARLPAEAGSLLVRAIEAVAAPVQQEKQRQVLEREEATECVKDVSAETFPEAVERENPNPCQDLFEHTRADALVTIAEHFLATSGEQRQWQGLTGSERCQVMLHVDINTLQQRSNAQYEGLELSNLDDKHWIPATTARRLACDATLVTVLENDAGLNIGRRARQLTHLRVRTSRAPNCVLNSLGPAHGDNALPAVSHPGGAHRGNCPAGNSTACGCSYLYTRMARGPL